MDFTEATNWVDQQGGLPSYISRIEKHLERKGMSKSHAIATAVNVAKKMCATGDTNWPGFQQVNAGSKADACAAVARWNAMKAAAGESARLQMEGIDTMNLSEVVGPGNVGKMLADLPQQEEFTEATSFGEGVRSVSGSKMQIRVISPGWGSSGYYSEAMLKDAASKGLFAPGTQMFLDHPTADQSEARPERSIRDLAAVITKPGVYAGDGVYAEADVFPPFREALAAMKDHIGVSIRARGFAEQGEAEGRSGTIISELSELASVDFVTRPGRGGAITALLESAVDVAEVSDTPWEKFTQADYSDEQWKRACLVHTDGEGKQAHKLPVREPNGQLNRNAVHAAAGRLNQLQPASLRPAAAAKLRGLYKQLGEDPPESLSGTKKESATPTVGADTTTGGPVSGTEAQGSPTQGTPTNVQETDDRVKKLETELAEARQALEIRSAAGKALADAERSLAEAKAENVRLRASEKARHETSKKLAESNLPEPCHAAVYAAVIGLEGRGLPLQESGDVDTDKLGTSIDAAIKAEEGKVAAILEHAGVGTPKNLGGGNDGTHLSPEKFEESLAGLFVQTGMDEKTAKLAAKGR